MGSERVFYNGGEILPFGLETEPEKLFFGLEREADEERELGEGGAGGNGEHHEPSKVSRIGLSALQIS